MPMYMQSFERKTSPSAGSSDEEMKKLMGAGWMQQNQGVGTFTALDDKFMTTSWDNVGMYSGPSLNDEFSIIFGLVLMALACGCICYCCLCCVCRKSRDKYKTIQN